MAGKAIGPLRETTLRPSDRSDLEAVARRWIGLWCAPVDWALFDRLHRDDFVDESSAGRAPTKAGFASGLAELVAAFPDLETTLDDLVVDEAQSRVAVRWTARGTNRARFLGVGPTGRKTTFRGIEILEIRGGQIARRWGEWDITEFREFRGHNTKLPDAQCLTRSSADGAPASSAMGRDAR